MKPKSKAVPQPTKGFKTNQTRSESLEGISPESWQDHDFRVRAIIFTVTPAELLKGNGLVLLQTLSDSITSLAADAPQPADKQHVASCSSGLLHLLAKLLSARKRPRDWKQAGYCGSVTAVLAASTAVRRLEGRMHWGADPMSPSDIIIRVASALEEITQLLSSQSEALQRLTQPAAQTQQQQQQQQLLLHQYLACRMLHWCSTRFVLNSMETHGGTSLQLRAVELAAVLAHSITNQEPTTTQDVVPYVVVYELLDRLLYSLVHLAHKDNSKGAVVISELHSSQAFMQLSLLLLLQLQIHNQNLDKDRSSSSSSSSCCDNDTVTVAGAAPAATTSSSSSSSSSLNSSADPAAAQQQQQQQQSDNTHQAYALIQQLWCAAGFPSEAMHGNWQLTLQAILEDGGLLPLTLKAAGLQGLAAASKQQHSSKSKAISSLAPYETLPGAPDSMLQAFVILSQALGKCVAHCSCDKGFDLDTDICYENCIEKLQRSKHPSRQQQQLLQAVVWPLPLFLLQTAARYGPQEALITRVAAEAAWFCCTCWQAPALLAAAQQQPSAAAAAAATAATAAAAATAATASAASAACIVSLLEAHEPAVEQLLSPMLKVWLQLIQQQLLQPHVGLLCVATAARQQQQQQQQEQGCSTSFQQTRKLLEGPMCSCCPPIANPKHSGAVCHASISSDSKSSTSSISSDNTSDSTSSRSSLPPTCALDCGRLHCLGVLLVLLQPLSYLCNTFWSTAVWRSKMPAVLLVFEVIIRQLLPLAVSCSSSSGEGCGSEQGTKRSSAVVQLYEMLNDSLFELLDGREGKDAPLMVVLLGRKLLGRELSLEAAGIASDTHSSKELQQQQQQQQQPPQQPLQQQQPPPPPQQQQQCAAESAPEDTGCHESQHQHQQQQQQQSAHLQLHQELDHQELQQLLQRQQQRYLAERLQLQRQFFSVIASHLKLCRCPGSPAQPYGYVFGHALQLTNKVARAQAKSLLNYSNAVHTVASLSEAQAALAPWLGLMGAYLREAALALRQQRGGVVAILDPDHAEAVAAGKAAAAAAAEGSVNVRLARALRNCNESLGQVLELMDLLSGFLDNIWHETVYEDDDSSCSSSSSWCTTSCGSDVIIDNSWRVAGDDGGAGSSDSGGGAGSSRDDSSGDAAAGSSCTLAVNTISSSSTTEDTTSSSSNTSTAVNQSSSSSDGGSGGSKLKSLWQSFWSPAGNSSSSKSKEGGEGLSDTQPVGDQDNKQQQQQLQQEQREQQEQEQHDQQQEDDAAGSAAAAAAAARPRCTPYDCLYDELDSLQELQGTRDLCENIMEDVFKGDVKQGGPGISTEPPVLSAFWSSPCFDNLAKVGELLGAVLSYKVPAPWRCNNPDCVNMAGVSELKLIGAKSCVCAGCKVARYCSRSCQAAHWDVHRSVCEQFQY